MNTGAVVVASYISGHTNRFRPVLEMSGQTMVWQTVEAFRSSGVDPVVVVTGMYADRVRAELKEQSAVLLHDPDHTDMLGSAKVGLRKCLETCDRIFITPVCIPPFSATTVQQLISRREQVCVPVRHGIGGHPVLLDVAAAERLLAYQGPDGLRGALRQMGDRVSRIPIEESHSASKLHFHEHIQVRLAGSAPFFGPGPRQLLLGIQSCGSVAGACQAIGFSYSKGRSIIRQMEKELGFSLVNRIQGGANGGSAKLTVKGELFLEMFARYERSVADYAAEIFEDYFGELEEIKKCD